MIDSARVVYTTYHLYHFYHIGAKESSHWWGYFEIRLGEYSNTAGFIGCVYEEESLAERERDML